MANITINEISQNYTYNIGNSSFATVALPITASWGPAYEYPADKENDEQIESLRWERFPSTQSGLENFVSTYRGPASIYRAAKDYSYQMAMTLLSSGYDVLVCRLCPGAKAEATIIAKDAVDGTFKKFALKAKYAGTFGNNLKVKINSGKYINSSGKSCSYYNFITYVVDSSGVETAVENIIISLDLDDELYTYYEDADSNFLTIDLDEISDESHADSGVRLSGGTDNRSWDADTVKAWVDRYTNYTSAENISNIKDNLDSDESKRNIIGYREWIFDSMCNQGIYYLLTDKLSYSPQRIISPGWDDADIEFLTGDRGIKITFQKDATPITPIHKTLMEVAYRSRCGTSLIDVPRCLNRADVHSMGEDDNKYAEILSDAVPNDDLGGPLNSLYTTHSALFAPWGNYRYVGMMKQMPAPPSFLFLLTQRAMILNQSLQYEWALPTNRQHNLSIGRLDYPVPKKYLDAWQKSEGVGVNAITSIPDLGVNVWGNSTLYNVPAATYQALANLSTRFLVDAVENIVYKCGISITFQYNNEQAYNKFYAGVTPLLDTMKNVNAIEGYYVKMAADINGLDQVNANTVIGKVYLIVNGVINDIIVDLVVLPPSADLNQYKA